MKEVFDKGASKEVFLEHIVKRISSRGLNLFLGAGISKDSPSNLPLAGEFRACVFRRLCLYEEPVGFYDRFANKLSNIPFESFAKIIVNGSDFFNFFLRIFGSGQPNKAHSMHACN